MKPQISVVLPVYNGGKYLEKAIDSVLKQQKVTFELLICDDCSTDNSYTFLTEKANNPNIKLYKNKVNRGLFPTLNSLIRESNADLIHLWSQDDMMLENCLHEVVLFHQKHPDITMSYSSVTYVDQNDAYDPFEEDKIDGTPEIISPQLHAKISIMWGCIAGNIANVTLSKKAIEMYGYFNETMKVSGDFEMWARLSKNDNIGFLNKKLVALRRHAGQLSRRYDSSYFRMKEDIPIIQDLKERVAADFKARANKCINWKLYPLYFNEIIYLLYKKQFAVAANCIQEVNKVDKVVWLIFKWGFVRFLSLVKLNDRFYYHLFLKE